MKMRLDVVKMRLDVVYAFDVDFLDSENENKPIWGTICI
jgi:hypothetical protein